ncbi:MAG: DUF4435 domain-containing protein [Prevotellaceae bacterium]|nr:DUF4435 domain-containing protein [Prevotellaceae bacterium]
MPSRLNKYVNNDYAKAAQRLRGSRQRRKIIAYVESYDDIFFWRTLLSELETEDIYFEVMLPSRTSLQKGKKTALLHTLSQGLGREMIVCVDADYDYLLGGCNADSRKVCANPYVFHTYAYAIENFQCYAPSLHGVCVMATLNDDHSVFDFETYLAEYSRIIYPLFVWNIWAYYYGRFKEFSMAEFAMIVTPGTINLFNPAPSLAHLKHKVDVAIARLQHLFPEGKSTYKPLKQQLADYGLTPETTYLYMRGHDLVEKVVAPLLDNACTVLRRRRQHEINTLATHSTQRQNELAGYLHSAADPAEMLRKHTDYRRCPLYKKIQHDVATRCLSVVR